MNKKLIYFIVILTITLGSCSKDFLELEPMTGQLEANFYKSESDAFFALTAVYDALSVQNWAPVPIMSDIFSDDAFTGGSDASDMKQWQEMEQGRMTSETSSSSDLWSRCYSGIYRANLYLEKQEGITWKDLTKKTRFEAEAKFLRAYFYWDLVRHYGWAPIILKVEGNVEDYKNYKQNTPAELYKQIATDLLAAIPALPAQALPSNEYGRVTKYAAEALLARIYMFYTGFAQPVLGISEPLSNGTTTVDKAYVINALEDVIAQPQYKLLTNYADLFDWAHQNSAESIFEWQYSEKGKSSDWGGWGIDGNFSVIFYGMRNPVGYNNFFQSGWSFATVSWSLYNAYAANDPRRDVSIFDADKNMTSYTHAYENTGLFNRKFMPRTAYRATAGAVEHNYPCNYIDIRLADVLLMAAELNLGVNQSKANDYLNRVRTRALGAAGAIAGNVTLNDVLNERRLELAGEGHRKWDLLRQGLDYAKQKIDASFQLPSGITNAADFTGREFNKDTWGMFPIPGSEIRKTNTGNLQQMVPAYK